MAQPTRSTARPTSTAPRSATPPTEAPGAPTTKIDEALATFLAAGFYALAKTRSGNSFEGAFGAALTRNSQSKTITDGKWHFSPSPAQFVVAQAQRAGLVEGDVLARLGVKS